MDSALWNTLQKSAVTAGSAERKTEKEKERERKRERERERMAQVWAQGSRWLKPVETRRSTSAVALHLCGDLLL